MEVSRDHHSLHRSFRWMGVVMIYAMLTIAACAADDEPRKSQFECIGSFGEKITVFAIQGHIVYTIGGYAVRAVDIRDPQRPRVLGCLQMPEPITNAEARGPALYIAMGNGGGAILVDATDPAHLHPIKAIGGRNRGTGVELMGDFLYIHSGGKWGAPHDEVLRITTPLHPVTVYAGSPRGSSSPSFVTNGIRLYVMRQTGWKDNSNTFVVEDCTATPSKRLLSHTFKNEETPGRLDLDTTTGKIWMGDPEMENRVLVGKLDLSSEAWCIGNEMSMAREHYQSATAKAARAKAEQEKQTLTDYQNISISSFKVVDRVAYAVGAGWTSIIDCHKPELPVTLGGCSLPGETNTCAVENDTVYAGVAGKQLCAINVSKPAELMMISSTTLPKESKAMAASGSRLFVADGEAGLLVLDTNNPAAMKNIGAYMTPDPCIDLATSGTLVFAITRHTLFVLDVSGNGAPALKGRLEYRSKDEDDNEYDQCSVKRLGRVVYLIHSHWDWNLKTTVRIVDVSKPETPRIMKVMHQNNPGRAELSETQSPPSPAIAKPQAKMAGWILGLPTNSRSTDGTDWAMEFYDVSDPSSPVYVDGYYSREACNQAVLFKEILYIPHQNNLDSEDKDFSVTILRRAKGAKSEGKR